MLSSDFCNDSVDGVICHTIQTQGQKADIVKRFTLILTHIQYISRHMKGKESPFEISIIFEMF